MRGVAGDHDVPEHEVPARRFVEHPARVRDEAGLGIGVGERGGEASVGSVAGLHEERVDARAGVAGSGAGGHAEEKTQEEAARPHQTCFVENFLAIPHQGTSPQR